MMISCEVCGMVWVKGVPSSIHRREHKKRLAVMEPALDPVSPCTQP